MQHTFCKQESSNASLVVVDNLLHRLEAYLTEVGLCVSGERVERVRDRCGKIMRWTFSFPAVPRYDVYGHTVLKAPALVRSQKLSSTGLD